MTYPIWDTDTAEMLANFAHSGQEDKGGQPYIDHPARVVRNLMHREEWQRWGASERSIAIMAAWLHDVFEDTDVPFQILDDTLCPIPVMTIVEALTHRPNEPRAEYYDRIKAAGPIAVAVKLADIVDNLDPVRLMMLDVETQRRLRDKYQTAIEHLTAQEASL